VGEGWGWYRERDEAEGTQFFVGADVVVVVVVVVLVGDGVVAHFVAVEVLVVDVLVVADNIDTVHDYLVVGVAVEIVFVAVVCDVSSDRYILESRSSYLFLARVERREKEG